MSAAQLDEVDRACLRRSADYRAMLAELPLCLRCLGRTLARVGHGLENIARGQVVAERIGWREPQGSCAWCRGVFGRIDRLVSAARAGMEGFEFGTFVVGTRVFARSRDLEGQLAQRGFENVLEPIQREINRVVGRRIEAQTGAVCQHRAPDLRVQLDPFHGRVHLAWRPLWIAGRYRKLARGIPQTRWSRRRSGGRAYASSVEEILAGPARELTGAAGAVLHGAGREDVDVRMLGRGRPFVLELDTPRRRSLDLEELEQRLGRDPRAAARELRWANREEVRRIKAGGWDKTYGVRFVLEGVDPGPGAVRAAWEELTSVQIDQRTPARVSHRRADKVRHRALRSCRLLRLGPGRYGAVLRASAGLYIKELIHGDQGRTRPSLAELLGRGCCCESLDVLAIHDGEGPAKKRGSRHLPESSSLG